MTETIVTFDGGTPGNNVVAGANGIESIPDALVPKFIAGFHGAAAVRSGTAANTADSRFRVFTGVTANHYGSIYLKQNTTSVSGSFATFLIWANSANSIMASVRVGDAQELNIRVGASTIVRAGSAGEVPLNAWFRFDWQVTGTTINWRLYKSPEAPASSTPDLSGTFTFTSATINKLTLGANSSTAMVKDWSYDTARFRDSGGTWYDGYAPGPSVRVWNGTAEIAASVTVWNGTAEVAASVASIV